MENKDVNADLEVVRVEVQMWEIVQITIRIIFFA